MAVDGPDPMSTVLRALAAHDSTRTARQLEIELRMIGGLVQAALGALVHVLRLVDAVDLAGQRFYAINQDGRDAVGAGAVQLVLSELEPAPVTTSPLAAS
jgi:hypothetical protein